MGNYVEIHEVVKISKCIMLCCVVHNICIDCDDEDIADITAQQEQNNSEEESQLDIHPRAQNLSQLGEFKRNKI